ncbi:hypothetical protein C8J57DRAFT_1244372 [Mycena rebaudengoi]|nr:hypothetical protein C8J57DRAFT_1244372 [Mycena rebaudengoi]
MRTNFFREAISRGIMRTNLFERTPVSKTFVRMIPWKRAPLKTFDKIDRQTLGTERTPSEEKGLSGEHGIRVPAHPRTKQPLIRLVWTPASQEDLRTFWDAKATYYPKARDFENRKRAVDQYAGPRVEQRNHDDSHYRKNPIGWALMDGGREGNVVKPVVALAIKIGNEEVQPLLGFRRTKKRGGKFVAREHAANKMIQRKNRRQSLVGLKPGECLRFFLPAPPPQELS